MKISTLIKMFPFEIERAACSKLNALLARRPSSAPFLSGDTYRAMADALYDETASCDPAAIFSGALVFVSSPRLGEFSRAILPRIQARFVLISHQGDTNIDSSYAAIADHPMVERWFAQNCMLEHPKVTPLPIGLEDRWRHNNGEISDFRRLVRNNSPRKPRIAYAFNLVTNIDKRVAWYKALRASRIADELPQPLNSSLYREIAKDYMFIASPPGNGLDCHRTWEAMYMGCVPIVEDNSMNRRFFEMGVPLALAGDLGEMLGWDEEELEARFLKLGAGRRPPVIFSPCCAEAFSRARA